jgi:hypothetical protein
LTRSLRSWCWPSLERWLTGSSPPASLPCTRTT